jgi:holin-like protein
MHQRRSKRTPRERGHSQWLQRAGKLMKVTMIKTFTFRSLYALSGFAILVVFFLLGSWLHRLGIPIPGGVLGLMFFYLSMSTGLVKLKWVEGMAGLMLRHMVLLFVPLTVGLMDMGELLSKQAVAITASLLVSLVAVLVTTGLLGRWLLPYDSTTANDGTEASR